ncbi:MAG: 7-cyano-7-deazaguanine synthase QueC [Gammaproteobacteria bacterium]|nr:7-cyano-7-deazaguanine synthase QueC [Gammaproteobacteria bacterium]
MGEIDIPRAVVLLSGGLDSTTCLAIAQATGYECYGLSFDYGQRHRVELESAQKLALQAELADYKVIPVDMRGIGGSALTDNSIDVPESESEGIPVTYVPARNTVFLAYALGWAEVLSAKVIFIGINALDYSGYPDCRPEYVAAFQAMANLATKQAVEGEAISIETPLINLTKAEIINRGSELGVDYSLTVSCYQADTKGRACGLCESCRLRKKGFEEAELADPTLYV